MKTGYHAVYENNFFEAIDYAKNKSVDITFHAPGDNVSLFCDYPLIRDGI